MNTESLRINLDGGTWRIDYRGYIETPIHPDCPDEGCAEIAVDEMVGSTTSLALAVADARAWALGSGFKIGSPRFEYGNVVTFKLRRP
jgi:hypothetical protein